jgi:hypothetical protein
VVVIIDRVCLLLCCSLSSVSRDESCVANVRAMKAAAWNLIINAHQFKDMSAMHVLDVKLHVRWNQPRREAGTVTTISNGISRIAK